MRKLLHFFFQERLAGSSKGSSLGKLITEFSHDLLCLTQAEVRALAQRMLRKRSREELLEGGYNKYAFHDAGLPRWFAEDQQRHAKCALSLPAVCI